jgi:polyisoprenoid-binding protein YceI
MKPLCRTTIEHKRLAMNRRSFPIYAILGLALFASPVRAETYNLDAGHTRVQYRVNHLGFSDMPGIFNDIKGTLNFDPTNPEASTIDATINASSVTMNNTMLDGKIKGGDFFNVAKFPTITFKSTGVNREGSAKGSVEGKLTFLGVTRPVTLDVTFNKKAWDKYAGAEAVGFTAYAKIHRSDFGMKYLLPDVGDDVTIRIDVEALKAKSDGVDKAAQVKTIDTAKDTKEADKVTDEKQEVSDTDAPKAVEKESGKESEKLSEKSGGKPSDTPPASSVNTSTVKRRPVQAF